MNEKIVKVTGRGGIHAVPDVTRLELTLKSLHDTYEDAYIQSKSNVGKLNLIMKEVGLESSLPKTIGFDIEKKNESQYDKYDKYVGSKFIGFEIYHKVKIDLGMDNILLNNVVKLIGKHLKQAEISIGYTVKDSRPFQLLMLERAVKDAKAKAEIMATACDCKLGSVKEINYSFSKLQIYSQSRQIHDAEEAICCEPESLDITPDDLSVSDDVTVVWELV